MSIELRKPGVVDQTTPGRRKQAELYIARVRYRATTLARRHAWTGWQYTRQLPTLALLLIAYSPTGLARLAARWVRYLRDEDTATLRAQHAASRETGDYVKVSTVRGSNLTARLATSGAVVAVVGVLILAWTAPHILAVVAAPAVFAAVLRIVPKRDLNALFGAALAAVGAYIATPYAAAVIPRPPAWLWWLVAAAAVAICGWNGRPQARPLVTIPGAQEPKVPPLTAPMVMAALVALGNSKMKDPDDIRLLTDPHRNGPGVQVDLELPPAVPARYVLEKREELAAALRRELGTVWPSVGRRHPGHLALYVGDQVLAESLQPPWPLYSPNATVDLFKPLPMFTDQRGEWVPVTLAYASMIVGSVPRMGKTFTLRQFLLAAGLDPRAKVYAIDGKGTGDLACCQHFATFYCRGPRPNAPERIEAVRAAVRDLRRELSRRGDVIDSLDAEECPENQVTSELVNRRPDLNLGPIVVGLDETQALFLYGDRRNKEHKAIREELTDGFTELAKLGPAVGIWVILATQQVNADTIPSSIANNAVLRFCLRIEGYEPNDRILGSGAYKRGVDATMLTFEDKGIGILKSDGAVPRIVRSVFGLDGVEADKVARRARALRVAAGTITDADAPPLPRPDIVDDVVAVMARHARRTAHLSELADWLHAECDGYDDADAAEVGRRLRNKGWATPQVKVGGRTNSGVRLSDLGKRPAEGDDETTNPEP